MKHYPSWRYHKSLGAKIIKSEAEEASGWHMSPADFEEKSEPVVKKSEESLEEMPEIPVIEKKSKKASK